MRPAAAALLWLIATVALAVAVPSGWLQRNIIDADGYTATAERAAADPAVQSAVAAQLSNQAQALISRRGVSVNSALVDGVAAGYTAGPAFAWQFGQANRAAHRWLFADTGPQPGHFTVDLAPMLSDTQFHEFLNALDVPVPDTVAVPLTAVPDRVQPGRLHPLRVWGPPVSIGAAALSLLAGLATVAVARRRGRALAGLGVSALLVGAAGWAGIAIGRRYLAGALDAATTEVRPVVDALADQVAASLHQWLTLTAAGGGALLVFGMFVALLGGMRRANLPGHHD